MSGTGRKCGPSPECIAVALDLFGSIVRTVRVRYEYSRTSSYKHIIRSPRFTESQNADGFVEHAHAGREYSCGEDEELP